MKLVSVQQMKALEGQANQGGLTYDKMMANAGLGLAQTVHQRFFQRPSRKVLGLVGSGNNGGDTLVALRHLSTWGWQTRAYLVKERGKDDDLLAEYQKAGGEIHSISEDASFATLRNLALSADVILDGILGTGIKLPLRGDVRKVLELLSGMQDLPPVAAVDCPSGVDCDSGKAAAECLPAQLTVCMAAVKQGLLKQPAMDLCGEIISVEIGLPDNLPAWGEISDMEVIDTEMVSDLMPARPSDSHKGTFGTCMIAAGSINYCGAVLLSARAAYRVGVGLVRAAIPGAIYDTLAGQMPEATWLILPHTLGVFNGEGAKIIGQNLERVSSMLIGPGWGQEEETLDFLKELLNDKGKTTKKYGFGFENGQEAHSDKRNLALPHLVIDADALKLIAQIDHWHEKIPEKAVLTPHPGEMAVLTGLKVKEIQANRSEIAGEYAEKWGQVVVLKGALTLVADPSGRMALVPVASPALATAGTGDVLAGMITGLIAQGLDPYSAAVSGAWLHARAGLAAAERAGNTASVTAGDVIQCIPEVIIKTGSCS